MKKPLILACLVLFGFAWNEYRTTRTERAQRDALAERSTRLQAETAHARQRLDLAIQNEADLTLALKNARHSLEKAVTPTPLQSVLALFEAHPALRAAWLEATKAQLNQSYHALFVQLDLPAEKVAQLKDLLVEQAQERLDLMTVSQAMGVSNPDAATAELKHDQDAKIHAEETALLGDAGAEAVASYQRALPLMDTMGDLASLIARSPTPLSSEQADELMTVLANASADYRTGAPASAASVDWPSALAQGQTFLKPVQYQALVTESQLAQVGVLVKQYFRQQGR